MRPLVLAGLVLLFATTPSDLKAQYPRAQARARTPVYRSVAPGRPASAGGHLATPRSVRPPNPTGFANRPYYGAYGYGNYSNGSTDGFPPFRGRRSR